MADVMMNGVIHESVQILVVLNCYLTFFFFSLC